MVLSIAAGRTLPSFEQHLPKGAAVIRSMPNTPASIGRGITVAVANAHVTAAQRATCDALLRAVGEVAWVEDEGLLDAVTAVSGSGPAYVFYLAECLAEAGVKAGLQPELAEKLARWTVAGAGELLHRADLGPDLLRQNVTSPNGTTLAALQVLMADDGLAKLMREAVAAATASSRELAQLALEQRSVSLWPLANARRLRLFWRPFARPRRPRRERRPWPQSRPCRSRASSRSAPTFRAKATSRAA